jgi:heptosyltransferase I
LHLCIVRLSSIGDVCHVTMMVQVLRKRHPHVKVTWIIGRVEYQLVKHLTGIDFIVFNKSEGLRGYIKLRRQLQHYMFDVLLHMQVSLRANIVARLVKAQRRIGFDSARAKEGHQWVVTEQVASQVEPHVLDGFFSFYQQLMHLPPPIDRLYCDFRIPVMVADRVRTWLAGHSKWLVICPAASKDERNWLPERYAQVADRAAQEGYRVMLCGSSRFSEHTLAASIVQMCQTSVVNLVGQTDLSTLVSILGSVKVVLAPDTGALHLAVSQGTPAIGLYAHSNPRRTGPYYNRDLVVSCYDRQLELQYGASYKQLPWGKRLKGAQLMQEIQVDKVMELIRRAETRLTKPKETMEGVTTYI